MSVSMMGQRAGRCKKEKKKIGIMNDMCTEDGNDRSQDSSILDMIFQCARPVVSPEM